MLLTVKFLAHELLVLLLIPFSILIHLIFFITSLPIYIYRWILPKILNPQFGYDTGKPLSGFAEIMSKETLEPGEHPPRCTIIANLIIQGHIDLQELSDTFERNCILAITSNGQPKYPELSQYPERRMGLLFWKDDENFSMRNHINLHVIDENQDDSYSEKFLTKLCEKIMNKPYPLKRSPWDIQLVQNYKNSRFYTRKEKDNQDERLTVLIFRLHHSLGDGFGFVNMCKSLLQSEENQDLPEIKYNVKGQSAFSLINACVTFPVKILMEWRRLISFGLMPSTIFHVSDSRQIWSQNYRRTSIIPARKIKLIKDTFGVKFGSVIESAYGAALRKISVKISKRKLTKLPENILLGGVLPKPNHPGTFTLHAYPMAYELPYGTDLNHVERLLLCDERVSELRRSLQPKFLDILVKAYTEHLPLIARFLSKNRIIPVYITNFRGPERELKWKEKRCLSIDFAAGGLIGAGGVALSVFGYAGNVQICAAAEKCVMSGEELEEFLKYICEEIDLLYEMALAKKVK